MQVILKMDVSDEPGNSIEQIERFISDEYPDRSFHLGTGIEYNSLLNYVLRKNHLEREVTVEHKTKRATLSDNYIGQ